MLNLSNVVVPDSLLETAHHIMSVEKTAPQRGKRTHGGYITPFVISRKGNRKTAIREYPNPSTSAKN